MKKIGVYFKTNYYSNNFKNENVVYNYNAKKIEITEVKLVEVDKNYLHIVYKTDEYKTGENEYNFDMKYVESYYIF